MGDYRETRDRSGANFRLIGDVSLTLENTLSGRHENFKNRKAGFLIASSIGRTAFHSFFDIMKKMHPVYIPSTKNTTLSLAIALIEVYAS